MRLIYFLIYNTIPIGARESMNEVCDIVALLKNIHIVKIRINKNTCKISKSICIQNILSKINYISECYTIIEKIDQQDISNNLKHLYITKTVFYKEFANQNIRNLLKTKYSIQEQDITLQAINRMFYAHNMGINIKGSTDVACIRKQITINNINETKTQDIISTIKKLENKYSISFYNTYMYKKIHKYILYCNLNIMLDLNKVCKYSCIYICKHKQTIEKVIKSYIRIKKLLTENNNININLDIDKSIFKFNQDSLESNLNNIIDSLCTIQMKNICNEQKEHIYYTMLKNILNSIT